MPELPEVETVVQGLLRCELLGKRVTAVDVYWPRLVEEGDARLLVGKNLSGISRRGKFIVMEFGSKCNLLIHLRMTGKIHLGKASDPIQAHEKGRILFQDIALCYSDVRTFGRWYAVLSVQQFLQHLGPDPFDEEFDAKKLIAVLKGTKRRLKALLLDQGFIAGIGNIYADEALFVAQLHPSRHADSLASKDAERLLLAIRQVLEQGIRYGGSSLGKGKGNFQSLYGSFGNNQERFQVYQRAGLPCFTCQSPIQKIVISQRSTHFCPNCQR